MCLCFGDRLVHKSRDLHYLIRKFGHVVLQRASKTRNGKKHFKDSEATALSNNLRESVPAKKHYRCMW